MMARPVSIAVPIGRIVAEVIAARHALEMKGTRQVAARRALNTEPKKICQPLHACNIGHGEPKCPGEKAPETFGETR